MSLSVLLVEDDRDLRQTLGDALTVEGFQVLSAADLADARARLAQAGDALDLVILDLGLPDGDGASFLGELRRTSSLPVIVVSAREGDLPKVTLLDAGADDYLVKPFSLAELLARIRVAMRHRGRLLRPSITHYEHDGLIIDLEAHRVSLAGEAIHLTPTEFRLLARLVRSAGRVVTHRRLLVDVWGAEFAGHTHYLRLYMAQLRAKLEAKPADPRRLLTEPGVGYRLIEPDTEGPLPQRSHRFS